jgi:simple sugar transport system ATP-binding protein
VADRSVAENATLTVTDQLGPYGTVLPSRTRTFAGRMIHKLDIKTPGGGTPVSALSGGNQQKVVIARAMATDPHVLVAIRPTNGVDVKSKEFLLGTIRQVADGGKAAVIVSDELDDLKVCDRVVVMFHGRAVAEFDRGWSDRDLVAAMEGVAQSSPASPAEQTEQTGR